tara:strand:- start:146 stop:805 length:660 start_codon:yes stop_codon:yes gene_type:complete
MNKDISILVTAIDRPDFHTKIFEDYVSYIGDIDCEWHISINNVTDQVEKTKENLERILSKYTTHFYTYKTGGTRQDWFNSAQHVIKLAYNNQPNKAYLWLEDDWGIHKQGSLKDDLLLLQNDNSYVALVDRPEVSFNPGLWGKKLFELLMYKNIIDPKNAIRADKYWAKEKTSPERICVPYPEANERTEHFNNIDRFKDAGRDWQGNKLNTKRTFHYHE